MTPEAHIYLEILGFYSYFLEVTFLGLMKIHIEE